MLGDGCPFDLVLTLFLFPLGSGGKALCGGAAIS